VFEPTPETIDRVVNTWARLQAVSSTVRRRQEAIERGELNVLPDTPASKRKTYILREVEMAALDEAIETLRRLLGIRPVSGPDGGVR